MPIPQSKAQAPTSLTDTQREMVKWWTDVTKEDMDKLRGEALLRRMILARCGPGLKTNDSNVKSNNDEEWWRWWAAIVKRWTGPGEMDAWNDMVTKHFGAQPTHGLSWDDIVEYITTADYSFGYFNGTFTLSAYEERPRGGDTYDGHDRIVDLWNMNMGSGEVWQLGQSDYGGESKKYALRLIDDPCAYEGRLFMNYDVEYPLLQMSAVLAINLDVPVDNEPHDHMDGKDMVRHVRSRQDANAGDGFVFIQLGALLCSKTPENPRKRKGMSVTVDPDDTETDDSDEEMEDDDARRRKLRREQDELWEDTRFVVVVEITKDTGRAGAVHVIYNYYEADHEWYDTWYYNRDLPEEERDELCEQDRTKHVSQVGDAHIPEAFKNRWGPCFGSLYPAMDGDGDSKFAVAKIADSLDQLKAGARINFTPLSRRECQIFMFACSHNIDGPYDGGPAMLVRQVVRKDACSLDHSDGSSCGRPCPNAESHVEYCRVDHDFSVSRDQDAKDDIHLADQEPEDDIQMQDISN